MQIWFIVLLVLFMSVLVSAYFDNRDISIENAKANKLRQHAVFEKKIPAYSPTTQILSFVGILLLCGSAIVSFVALAHTKTVLLHIQTFTKASTPKPTTQPKKTLAVSVHHVALRSYAEIAKPGDSLQKIIGRMISVYEVLSGDLVSLKRRQYMEMVLAHSFLHTVLRTGDEIDISAKSMQTVAQESKQVL